MDFFEAQGARKTDEGKIKNIEEIAATPRIKRFVFTYTLAEAFAVEATERVKRKKLRSTT